MAGTSLSNIAMALAERQGWAKPDTVQQSPVGGKARGAQPADPMRMVTTTAQASDRPASPFLGAVRGGELMPLLSAASRHANGYQVGEDELRRFGLNGEPVQTRTRTGWDGGATPPRTTPTLPTNAAPRALQALQAFFTHRPVR